MMISERQAALRLGVVGIPSRQARLALAVGLAGDAVRTTAATLYDERRVAELVDRPSVDEAALPGTCPDGVLVDRRVVEPRRFDEDGLSAVEPLVLGPWATAAVGMSVDRHGWFPLVATVYGFVVIGADIVDIESGADGMARLDLRPAGPWFGSFRQRRWRTGPGPSWLLRGHRFYTTDAMGG